MKAIEIKETIEVQDGGCCGTFPEAKETVSSACCNNPEQEEILEADGGCC